MNKTRTFLPLESIIVALVLMIGATGCHQSTTEIVPRENVHGQIVDSATSKPIGGAFVAYAGRTTWTDAAGFFHFDFDTTGDLRVAAWALGYDIGRTVYVHVQSGHDFGKIALAQHARLVAYYALNGNAFDSSGNGHNGDLIGSFPRDEGHDAGGAMTFGPNSSIVIPTAQDLNITRDFTICFWVKMPSPTDSATFHILSKSSGVGSDFRGYAVSMKSFQILSHGLFELGGDAGVAAVECPGNIVIDSFWQFITIRVSPQQHSVAVTGGFDSIRYVSSIKELSGNLSTSAPFILGGEGFQGSLDDVRIFDGLLDRQDVSWLGPQLVLTSEGQNTKAAN